MLLVQYCGGYILNWFHDSSLLWPDSVVLSIFALVDGEDHCIPVTVYNMAAGAGFAVGDSVAIPEPFYQETDFSEKDKVSVYLILRFCNFLVEILFWWALPAKNCLWLKCDYFFKLIC